MKCNVDPEDLRGSLEDCLAFAQAGDTVGLAAYLRDLPYSMGKLQVMLIVSKAAYPGNMAEAVLHIF